MRTIIPQASSWSARIRHTVSLPQATRARRPSRGRVVGAGRGSGCRLSRAVNQKVLPPPGAVSTPMPPRIISASRREMARPRPVPP